MGFALSSLRDNFTDNSISTSAWVEGESGSATAAETSGQIRFTLPSSTAGTHTTRLTSRYTYDLTADSFYINIETMVATGVAATAFFQLYKDSNNALQWIQVSGTIYARTLVAGVSTDRYSAAWSASTYKYLRIRESGGNILWESSTNGTSWTTRATVAVSSLFAATDLSVDFGATCGNIASPGSFRLDDVNLILPALVTNWRWTQARRALVNRNRVETLAIDTANTVQGYLITADGVDASDTPSGNVRYWSGPAGGGRLLTQQPDEAAAQAMAVNLPLDGRFDLPEMIDMRVVRLGHRSIDGNSYVLREYYPRRLVQADDIEAESVAALHIRAGSITADRITAAFTITGKNIQTADSGARVVLSGDANGGLIGYGATDTYDPVAGTGTYQILWDRADGKFYFGGGDGMLDATGANFLASMASGSRYVRWGTILGASDVAAISGYDSGSKYILFLSARTGTGRPSQIYAEVADGTYQWTLDEATGRFRVQADDTTLTGGLNVGTATGAATGDIKASGKMQPGGVASSYTANYNASLANNGTMALGMSNFGLAVIWAGGNIAFFRIDGATHTTAEMLDPGGIFSATAGTASSINVYWSAGNSRYEIENKRGSAIAVRIWLLDAA